MYLKDLEKVSIDDLSLKDRLYLATLLVSVKDLVSRYWKQSTDKIL